MVRSVLVSLHNSMLDTDFTVCYEPANQEFWKNRPNNGILSCRVRNHVQTGHCTEQGKAILQGSNGSSSSITHNCVEKQENLTICRHQEVSVSQSEWLTGVTNLCNSSLWKPAFQTLLRFLSQLPCIPRLESTYQSTATVKQITMIYKCI